MGLSSSSERYSDLPLTANVLVSSEAFLRFVSRLVQKEIRQVDVECLTYAMSGPPAAMSASKRGAN